ncbi:MAG: hypothetical protein MUC50_00525, partial [Myxococcota bacterium]|nr:hypothetical protein [Myxococcota bacterium]
IEAVFKSWMGDKAVTYRDGIIALLDGSHVSTFDLPAALKRGPLCHVLLGVAASWCLGLSATALKTGLETFDATSSCEGDTWK